MYDTALIAGILHLTLSFRGRSHHNSSNKIKAVIMRPRSQKRRYSEEVTEEGCEGVTYKRPDSDNNALTAEPNMADNVGEDPKNVEPFLVYALSFVFLEKEEFYKE